MKKGEIMTEDQKRKIGAANKGRVHTPESRSNMSKSHTGVPLSEEHKKRLGDSHKGRTFSEETRRKISESNKGKHTGPSWNKGIPPTKETREKSSISHKGNTHSKETKQKMSFSHRGKNAKENNYHWKGGITPLNKTIRKCPQMNEWRDAVFARDNYTCQRTGQRGGILEAHHIIPFAALMKEYNIKTLEDAENCQALWDIRNGITLSIEAHRAIHRRNHDE